MKRMGITHALVYLDKVAGGEEMIEKIKLNDTVSVVREEAGFLLTEIK